MINNEVLEYIGIIHTEVMNSTKTIMKCVVDDDLSCIKFKPVVRGFSQSLVIEEDRTYFNNIVDDSYVTLECTTNLQDIFNMLWSNQASECPESYYDYNVNLESLQAITPEVITRVVEGRTKESAELVYSGITVLGVNNCDFKICKKGSENNPVVMYFSSYIDFFMQANQYIVGETLRNDEDYVTFYNSLKEPLGIENATTYNVDGICHYERLPIALTIEVNQDEAGCWYLVAKVGDSVVRHYGFTTLDSFFIRLRDSISSNQEISSKSENSENIEAGHFFVQSYLAEVGRYYGLRFHAPIVDNGEIYKVKVDGKPVFFEFSKITPTSFSLDVLHDSTIIFTDSCSEGDYIPLIHLLAHANINSIGNDSVTDDEEEYIEGGSSWRSAEYTSQESIVPEGITNVTLVALRYNNRVVAYRFKTSMGNFDITKKAALRYGVSGFKIEKAITLESYNGMLMSKSEIANKRCIPDISESEEDCTKLFDALFS